MTANQRKKPFGFVRAVLPQHRPVEDQSFTELLKRFDQKDTKH